MKTLVLVCAHPDDASFICSGTIAKYVDSGWEVHLLCVACGEKGNEASGAIRQKELETAGTIVGISVVTLLGYAEGIVSAQHPGELEDKIYRQMVTIAPDVVITFESGGINNDPDHSKTSLSTTFAFQKYAHDAAIAAGKIPVRIGQRERRSFEQTAQEKKGLDLMRGEPQLYYACVPESVITYLKKQKQIPAESFGKPWMGTPDKFITTVINIERFKAKKIKAMQVHASQRSDSDSLLPLSLPPFLKQECFILRMEGEYEVFMGKTDSIRNRF